MPTNLFRPGVFVWMLPYLEQKGIFDENWVGNQPYPIHQTVVKVYQSAMDPTLSDPKQVTSFGANIRVFSTWGAISPYDAPVDLSSANPMPGGNDWFCSLSTEKITDGAGNTIFFATRYGRRSTADRDRLRRRTIRRIAVRSSALADTWAVPRQPPRSRPSARIRRIRNLPTLALTSTDGSHCNDDRGTLPHSFGEASRSRSADVGAQSVVFHLRRYLRPCYLPHDGRSLGSDW